MSPAPDATDPLTRASSPSALLSNAPTHRGGRVERLCRALRASTLAALFAQLFVPIPVVRTVDRSWSDWSHVLLDSHYTLASLVGAGDAPAYGLLIWAGLAALMLAVEGRRDPRSRLVHALAGVAALPVVFALVVVVGSRLGLTVVVLLAETHWLVGSWSLVTAVSIYLAASLTTAALLATARRRPR